MRTLVRKSVTAALIFTVGTPCALPQAFVNLDFERPILPLMPDQYFEVPTSQAIPGWTAYTYEVATPSVLYNTVSAGAAAVSVQGPGSLEPVLQGSYSVELQPSTGGPPGAAAIAQTGQVPPSSLSVTFLAGFGSGFQLTVGGQNVPLIELALTANYEILGGDISSFAGQTEDLQFTGGGILDDIQFSSSPVPEPGTLALLSCGVMLIGFSHRRRRR